MPEEREILEDRGYVIFQVGSCEARVDLFAAFNRLVDLANTNKKPSELHAEIRQYMTTIGLPAGSDQLAVAFAERISNRVAELKKNGSEGGTQNSPGSMESTPSSSPESNSPS